MADEKKSKNELLQEKLMPEKESSWSKLNDAETKKVFAFAEDYKKFMKESKTERHCIKNILAYLKDKGYKEMSSVKSFKPGDKVYKNVKDKALIAAVVGKNLARLNLVGSHVDSPRLDLKPSPLYEDANVAVIQTHYYGGIKHYQWVNTPLALVGIVMTKDGKKVEVSIGEKESDPKFLIPDLLPHLAKDQLERPGKKVIQGEELLVICGNIPINDKKIKEQIKLNILKELNDKYGMTDADFATAELEFVPAANPTDIGIDRSMVGAYGQDDKVCAYTSLRALLETSNPKNTAVSLFVDKEEIGSVGDTGAASFILKNFVSDYLAAAGLKISESKLFENSKAVSADVTCAMDPIFRDVNDPKNVSYLGKGVSIEKYGGGGGKFNTQDAHAEYMSYLRTLAEKNNVSWQTGELGKIDVGGGGTIGMYLSRYGMDCADIGPCVLGMHSPMELSSKADVYMAYLFYKAFMND